MESIWKTCFPDTAYLQKLLISICRAMVRDSGFMIGSSCHPPCIRHTCPQTRRFYNYGNDTIPLTGHPAFKKLLQLKIREYAFDSISFLSLWISLCHRHIQQIYFEYLHCGKNSHNISMGSDSKNPTPHCFSYLQPSL